MEEVKALFEEEGMADVATLLTTHLLALNPHWTPQADTTKKTMETAPELSKTTPTSRWLWWPQIVARIERTKGK